MTNKILLTLTIVFLLLSVPRWFLGEDQNLLFTISLVIAEWLALILMLINGTLIKSRFMKVMYFLIGLVVLGMVFKILHLTGADEILMISMMAVPLAYTIHFFMKKRKTLLDVLKELTVISHFIISLLTIVHVIPSDNSWEATLLSNLIFWSTFFYFVAFGIKERILLHSQPG